MCTFSGSVPSDDDIMSGTEWFNDSQLSVAPETLDYNLFKVNAVKSPTRVTLTVRSLERQDRQKRDKREELLRDSPA